MSLLAVLNPPKSRRRPAKKKNPSKKKAAKAKGKRMATKRRRRRSTSSTRKTTRRKKASNPKRRRRKSTARKTTTRRRRRKASNPPKRRRRTLSSRRRRSSTTTSRRRRRKNPARRTSSRRRRRRRSNPSIKSGLKGLLSMNTLKLAGEGVVGFGGALSLPAVAANLTGYQMLNRGYVGVVSSGVSAVLIEALARALGAKRESAVRIRNAGLAAAGVKLVIQLLPAHLARKLVPLSELRSAPSPAAVAAAQAKAAGGTSGMGRLMSPQQLMAGEARAQHMQGMGDYMQLNGHVPARAIANGPGGVGAYLQFGQSGQVPQLAASTSFVPQSDERF